MKERSRKDKIREVGDILEELSFLMLKRDICIMKLIYVEKTSSIDSPEVVRALIDYSKEVVKKFDSLSSLIDSKMKDIEEDWYEDNPKYTPLQDFIEAELGESLKLANESQFYQMIEDIDKIGLLN